MSGDGNGYLVSRNDVGKREGKGSCVEWVRKEGSVRGWANYDGWFNELYCRLDGVLRSISYFSLSL